MCNGCLDEVTVMDVLKYEFHDKKSMYEGTYLGTYMVFHMKNKMQVINNNSTNIIYTCLAMILICQIFPSPIIL